MSLVWVHSMWWGPTVMGPVGLGLTFPCCIPRFGVLGLRCPIWGYGCPRLGLTPYGRVPNCPGSLRGEVGIRFSLFLPLVGFLGDPILGGGKKRGVSPVWVPSM